MKLSDLIGRRVAVWGTGHEGRALLDLLAVRAPTRPPVVIDDHPDAGGSETGGLEVVAPGHLDWAEIDVLVRSPGVSRYRPELAAARAAGVEVTTSMAIWLEDAADQMVVGITGTKGKSTTATLTSALLQAEGRSVTLLGNIGRPVTDAYDAPASEYYVVEISSYQAAETTRSPRVCVVTSLAPDHLDWHGGIEPYYRDKLRLIEAGPEPALAVGGSSPEALMRTAHHEARLVYGPRGRVVLDEAGWVRIDGHPVVDARPLASHGLHDRWNLCGAIAAVLLATGEMPNESALDAVVAGFSSLPSRCHSIGTREGVEYVDDALASNPFATATSLAAFPDRPVTVILGGADRGVDPAPLVEAVRAHGQIQVVLLPPDAERWQEALGDHVVCALADDLADAVARAQQTTPRGGVVLFSPAAPTPAGLGGYGARSREFARAAGLGPE